MQKSKRRGEWMQTYAGLAFWPLDPWGLVARHVPVQYAAWGLLHDASEAYLVDLPRPLKNFSMMGREYKKIELRLQRAICHRFGLQIKEPACVKEIDDIVLMTEARDLLGKPPMPWGSKVAPLAEVIHPWGPEQSEDEFLTLALKMQKTGCLR